MLTLVCHFKQVMHRGWAYFQAPLAFTRRPSIASPGTVTALRVGLRPLSIAEFSL